MYLTLKIPVMGDKLSPRKRPQLVRLTARDTRVIRRYLEVIAREEDSLWWDGWEGKHLDPAKLDALTLTSNPLTRKRKDGTISATIGRPVVKYDPKGDFHERITVRELKECRDTAFLHLLGYRNLALET